MEEISFTPLSEGLGFYEKSPVSDMPNGTDKKTADLQKKNLLSLLESPHFNLPETLDLDDTKNYEHLIALLEKPWLGKNVVPGFCSDNSPVEENKKGEQVKLLSSTNATSSSKFLRKENATASSINTTVSSQSVLNENTLNKNILNKKAQIKSENKLVYKKTFYFPVKAYLIDVCIVSFLFFPPFVLFVFLTQSSPIAVLKSIVFSVLPVFLFFSQIYCLLCRLFCFETFGEAMAKMRLFTLSSSQDVHPYMLFWRFFISCVTGVIFLPLFSLIFKKDFTARLTGLYFQKTG